MRHPRTTGGLRAARRGARRWRLPGRVASFGLGLAVFATAALLLLLARGPLDLAEALPRLEAMANDALGDATGGIRVEIGAARLGLGPRAAPAPGVHLEDLRLVDADGAVIAEAPTVRIGFRPLDLIAGRLRLSTVTVLGASVSLIQPGSGAVVGDIAPLQGDPGDRPPLFGMLARLAAAPPPLLESLSQIAFEDTSILLEGTDPAMSWPLVGVSVRFALRDGTLAAAASVPLGDGLPAVAVTAALAREGGVRIEATVPAIRPSLWPGAPAELDAIDLSVSAAIAATLGADGRVEAASATLVSGPGIVTLAQTPFPVDSARLGLRLDDGALAVEALAVEAASLALTATGRISGSIGSGPDDAVTVDLTLGQSSLPIDLRPDGGRLARFQAGAVALRLQRNPWRVDIADASLSRGDLTVGLSGTVSEAAEGWLLALSGAIRDLGMPDLLALWPRTLAPGALRWMQTHMEAGHVEKATFSVGGTLDAPRAALDFAFRDARATPLPPLPPITGARGWGRVDNAAFTLGLAEGSVEMPGTATGAIDLRGSTFHLEPLNDEVAPALIAVRGEGPVSTVLALIGSPPLSLLDRVAIRPDAAGGRARVAADLVVPLRRDLALRDVGVAVSATVTDARLALDAPLGAFSAPTITLEADTDRLRLTGNGQIGRSAVAVQWDEVFAPAADATRTTLAVSIDAEQADLAALGMSPASLGPAVNARISGVIPIRLRLRREGADLAEGATAFETSIDLRNVSLSAPALGVSKPFGAGGTAQFDGVASSSGIEIDSAQLDGADIMLRGRAQLDEDWGLVRLDLETLRVGAATDVAAVVVRAGSGFDATLRGRSLDISQLLQADAIDRGDTATAGPTVEVRLILDRLVLTPSLAVTAARGEATRRADGSLSGVLNATGPADGALSVTLKRDGHGAGTVRASSRDAGALAREVGLFSRALGGNLDLSARLQGGGAVEGEARITDVIVSDDPRLDTLLRDADLEPALARLRTEGIRFDTVRAPFRWQGDVLSLREAVAYGPTIGLSLSGTYTRSSDRLAMSGVFTPLYGLNSLIGNLPLIGGLLTGGEGQGLLAFTFDLTGLAASPAVSVNPFSVLLPGALRQILQPGPGNGFSPDPG